MHLLNPAASLPGLSVQPSADIFSAFDELLLLKRGEA